jgi:Immunity protein 70
MGLYLCVFAGGGLDEELDGVEVGSYDDFDRFRRAVNELEPGGWGSRFPVLMLHEDSDGRWSPDEAISLEMELLTIGEEMEKLAPQGFPAGWQADVAKQFGLSPKSLRDCFIDVDGEPLIDRLLELARLAGRERLPILFQ